MPYYESNIQIANGSKSIFSGSRLQFKEKYFANCTNYKLECWCADNGWSLTIDEEIILN